MNGPKMLVDEIIGGVVAETHGKHTHHHGVVKLVPDLHISKVIEADSKLVQDHSTDRAHFQGRFRATTYGDFKNRPGHAPELLEAQIEDHEREDVKAAEAAVKIELETAAAAMGVVVEDHELHRLADDGGPVHD